MGPISQSIYILKSTKKFGWGNKQCYQIVTAILAKAGRVYTAVFFIIAYLYQLNTLLTNKIADGLDGSGVYRCWNPNLGSFFRLQRTAINTASAAALAPS